MYRTCEQLKIMKTNDLNLHNIIYFIIQEISKLCTKIIVMDLEMIFKLIGHH